ncbi:rhodanese-like domain-containing protein [Pelagibacteraceae bacterium]|jgi:rhodanese-related sulfurtransferase|nr:rhodanese-like domain-containing protein [Pelagibacteraceae bacterium]|tara:strand:- start:1618 stop:1977 length:360 start_codon:yes stop_codon:yes gene_type:complete
MIKQIKSSEIKKFIEKNPKTVLLDVRTEDEWNSVGKPVSDNLGIKTFFITISQDSGFIESVKKKVSKENQILVMCAAGGRSIIAANLLKEQGYIAHNISDGFSGNGIDLGWKKEGLPSV